MYLVAVLDWFSRYVVSWELDQTLEMPFVLRAVDRALATATPTIWNSDQGSHFTSPQYVDRLQAAGTRVSIPTQFVRYWVDGRGRALDLVQSTRLGNIFTERLPSLVDWTGWRHEPRPATSATGTPAPSRPQSLGNRERITLST